MRFRRFSAVLMMLAIWLTASQHCNLEAAGVWHGFGEGDAGLCCSESSTDCAEDNCEVVEDGSMRATNTSLKVPAPAVGVCACYFRIHEIVALAAVESPQTFDPIVEPWLDWVPEWQFKRRAAPPSRAPSSVLA